MANELVQGLLQSLLQPQQGPNPADIAAALSSRTPVATMAAMQAPQLGRMFGQQFRGLMGGITGKPPMMTADEAMRASLQQVAAQPDLMNSSVGLAKMAQAASTVGRTAEAMQFSLMASQKKAEEQEMEKAAGRERQQITQQSFARNTNIQAVESTLQAVDAQKNPGLYNALQGLRQQLAGEMTPTDASKVQETISTLFERYKTEMPKADVVNYRFPTGDVAALRTNEEGLVSVLGADGIARFIDPVTAGLQVAPSTSRVTTSTDETPSPAFIDGAIQRAEALKLLPTDPNSPAALSFMSYLNAGALKNYEDIPKFFENYADTPAAQQARRTFNMGLARDTGILVQNVNNALQILNNPNSNIGPTWSILADYPVNSDARSLKQQLETVKSQVTFEKIQDMKEQAAASGSTGTGLGSVAVAEFTALGNAVANLDNVQKTEALRDASYRIMVHAINTNNAANNRPIVVLREEINTVYPASAFKVDPATSQTYLDMGVGDPVPVSVADSAEEAVTLLQRL